MKKFLTLGLLVLMGISACNLANESLSGQAEKVKLTLTTDIDKSGATKVAFDNLSFSWASGDQLNVYGYNTTSGKEYDEDAVFALTPSGVGKRSAAFTGELSPEPTIGSNIYASYGAVGTIDKNSDFAASFTQPHIQLQKHKANGDINPVAIGDYTYMYGKSSRTYNSSMGTNFPISMKNVMSIIDFKLSGFSTSNKVEKLTFTLDNPLLGSVEVNFDTNTITAGTVDSPANISVDIKDASDNLGVYPGSGGVMTIRMALLPQTISASTFFTVCVQTEGLAYVMNKSFLSAKVLAPGVKYDLDVDFSDMTSLNNNFANKEGLGYYSDLDGSLVEEYLYVAGTHQISIYEKGSSVRSSLANIDGSKFLKISDIPTTMVISQSYNMEVASLGLGLTDEILSLKVVKMQAGKAWLATSDNSVGFIVSIP